MRATSSTLLVSAWLLAACGAASTSRPAAECPPCAPPAHAEESHATTAPPVVVATTSGAPGPTTFLARVMPDGAHSANIASPVEGVAETLRAEVGDHVAANDVVAVVTRTDNGRQVQVRTPVAGTVIERPAALGAAVAPHGPPMFFVADLSAIWVVAEVPQNELPTIRAGAPVAVQVAMFPDRVFAGVILRVHPAVDPTTGMGSFVVALPNEDQALRPGSDARVQLTPAAPAQ